MMTGEVIGKGRLFKSGPVGAVGNEGLNTEGDVET